MDAAQRVVTCPACRAESPIRASYPGFYTSTCPNCKQKGHYYFPPPRPGASREPRRTEFTKVARFKTISRFDRFYHQFESTAEHVLPGKWGLLGVYLGLTLLAEIVVAAINEPFWGLVLHTIVLMTLLVQGAAMVLRSEPVARFALAATILPVVRIVSLTTPIGKFSYLQWFVLIGIVLAGAIYGLMRVLDVRPDDVGLRMPAARHVPLELVAVGLGVVLGMVEFALLRPGPLIETTDVMLLVGPVLLLVLFSGLVEETIFRGVLPRFISPVYGVATAILLPAAAQAVFDISFLNPIHILVVFASGIAFGLVARRTGSVLGVGLAHGLANGLLFLVLPVTGLPF